MQVGWLQMCSDRSWNQQLRVPGNVPKSVAHFAYTQRRRSELQTSGRHRANLRQVTLGKTPWHACAQQALPPPSIMHMDMNVDMDIFLHY